jgi:exonuclease SbcC
MSNITIKIKDFQSLIDVNLVLEKGLNIIIGKTNAGKSAVIRAVDSALFNSGQDDMVRVGNRYSEVYMSNDSNSFNYKRDSHGKNNKSLYQINDGEVLNKVGRTQLDEICKLFNITDVKLANGVKERINFWYQGKEPFLVTKTSGQLFEFLSQSSHDKYIQVVKTLKQDTKTLRNDIDTINVTIDTLKNLNNEKKTYLDKSIGFDSLYVEIVTLNDIVSEFTKIMGNVSTYDSLKARVSIKTKTLKDIKTTLDKYPLDSVTKDFNDLEELNSSISLIKDSLNTRNSKELRYAKLKPQLVDVSNSLTSLEFQSTSIKAKLDELQVLNDSYLDLQRLVSSFSVKKTKIFNLTSSLDSFTRSTNNLNKITKSILTKVVSLEDEAKDLEVLQNLILDYKLKKEKLISKTTEASKLKLQSDKVYEEFEDFKTSIGHCPYCNSTLNTKGS